MIPLSTFSISFVAFSICLFIIILIFVTYFNRNFSSASSSRRNCFCLADPEHQFEITTFFGVFPRDGGDEKLSGISVFTYFPSEPDYSISNHEPHLVCKQFCASRLLHLLRNFLLCHSNLLQDQIGATGGKDNSERNVHSYKHLFSFNHFNLHPATTVLLYQKIRSGHNFPQPERIFFFQSNISRLTADMLKVYL